MNLFFALSFWERLGEGLGCATPSSFLFHFESIKTKEIFLFLFTLEPSPWPLSQRERE